MSKDVVIEQDFGVISKDVLIKGWGSMDWPGLIPEVLTRLMRGAAPWQPWILHLPL